MKGTDLDGRLVVVADRLAAVSDGEHPGDAVHAGRIRAQRARRTPETRTSAGGGEDPRRGRSRGGAKCRFESRAAPESGPPETSDRCSTANAPAAPLPRLPSESIASDLRASCPSGRPAVPSRLAARADEALLGSCAVIPIGDQCAALTSPSFRLARWCRGLSEVFEYVNVVEASGAFHSERSAIFSCVAFRETVGRFLKTSSTAAYRCCKRTVVMASWVVPNCSGDVP